MIKGRKQFFVRDLSEATATAKSFQSCLTLCNPIDGSPPGSPFPGILQARTLEWVAMSFSNAWKWKVKVKSLSRVRPSATPWTAAFQAPPSMGFSRQEYWSGAPLPSLKLCYTKTGLLDSACIYFILPFFFFFFFCRIACQNSFNLQLDHQYMRGPFYKFSSRFLPFQ